MLAIAVCKEARRTWLAKKYLGGWTAQNLVKIAGENHNCRQTPTLMLCMGLTVLC